MTAVTTVTEAVTSNRQRLHAVSYVCHRCHRCHRQNQIGPCRNSHIISDRHEKEMNFSLSLSKNGGDSGDSGDIAVIIRQSGGDRSGDTR